MPADGGKAFISPVNRKMEFLEFIRSHALALPPLGKFALGMALIFGCSMCADAYHCHSWAGFDTSRGPVYARRSFREESSERMNDSTQTIRDESRWPPALSIVVVLCILATLPGHVHALPTWVSYLTALAVLVPMAGVALTRGNTLWLGIERTMIILLAAAYVANTIAELADMIGVITIHPSGENAFALLSSAVAIWLVNVLAFSLLYWQIDRGGPYARASKSSARPDWVFPQPGTPEDQPLDWRPLFLDYLYLGFNTATAFSPTDAAPLTRRAKMLMMIESTISLLTSVIVLSRAINAIPS